MLRYILLTSSDEIIANPLINNQNIELLDAINLNYFLKSKLCFITECHYTYEYNDINLFKFSCNNGYIKIAQWLYNNDYIYIYAFGHV